MITNTADLEVLSGEDNALAGDGLGWGWSSITSAVKKAVKAPVKATTWATKKTIIDPTKIVAKSAYRAGAGTVSATGKLVRGDVVGAGKGFVRAGVEPVRGGAQLVKHGAKTAYEASKYVTNLALWPVRSRLNILKDRRAKLISWEKRGSKMPSTVEKAQARKDVKSMLSRKGAHGKMLAWLAGGDPNDNGLGDLGVVGYDDAALAAIATALTTSAIKILSDAAKSKFAPVDAAKAGLKAGGSQALTTATETTAAKLAPTVAKATAAKQTYTDFVRAAEADAAAAGWAPPATVEEVAAEPYYEAEEMANEEETAAMEGVLRGLGMYDGFMEAAQAAAAPSAMDKTTAQKIAGASHRLICQAPEATLRAIGGPKAPQVVGSFCRALEIGHDAGVRATLPTIVQIAAQYAVSDQATSRIMPTEGFGGLGCASCGIDGHDLGMLAAFAGADPDELEYGLAEVGAEEVKASDDAKSMPMLALLPVAAAVLAGFWMATH
jgi:hypothetical protein